MTQAGLQSITCATGEVHSRCFEYDSLKQLTSANNLETSAITYAYDPDGNLSQRTQGAVTASLQYDPLGRLSLKSYAGVTTPAVTNCYDGVGSVAGTPDGSCVAGSVPNATGRLTDTRNSVSKTSYSASPRRNWQRTPAIGSSGRSLINTGFQHSSDSRSNQ